MQCRMLHRQVLLITMILMAACGDGGPETESFEGRWQLTSVNNQTLPAAGTTTGGQAWAAAVLEVGPEFGLIDRCWEDPSTSTRTSHSSPLFIAPISGSRITLSYFDRRASPPDTATLNGAQVTLRYRNTQMGPAALDVLTFVPLTGQLPPACNLALND
jgi:hypothetical protein